MNVHENESLAEKVFQNAYERAFDEFLRNLTMLKSSAISAGTYGGNRFGFIIQKEIIVTLNQFGTEVNEILSDLDPDFGPFSTQDFKLVKPTLYKLRNQLYRKYSEVGRSKETFGETLVYLDRERIQLECDKILNQIEISRRTLHAKRSFFRWALGNSKRRIFTASTALIGAVLSSLLSPIKEFLLKLI